MAIKTFSDLLREHGVRPIEVARGIGVDKATVSRWCSGRIPAERCLDVERLTGIPRQDLRPDVFGDAA